MYQRRGAVARAEQWRGRSSAMPKGKPHPRLSSSDDDEDDTTPLCELKGVQAAKRYRRRLRSRRRQLLTRRQPPSSGSSCRSARGVCNAVDLLYNCITSRNRKRGSHSIYPGTYPSFMGGPAFAGQGASDGITTRKATHRSGNATSG